MMPGPTLIIACPACGASHQRATLASGNTLGARLWTDGKMEAPMLPSLPAVTRCAACARLFWVEDAPLLGEVDPFDIGRKRATKLDVVLASTGPDRLRVMAVLRQVLPLDLEEVKRLLARLPVTLLRKAPYWKVEPIRSALTEAGASVEIVDRTPPAPAVPEGWLQAPSVEALDIGGLREALRVGLGAGAREREIHLRVRIWWSDNDPWRHGGAGPWIPYAERPTAERENLERLAQLLGEEPSDEESMRLLRAEIARELGCFEEAQEILAHPMNEQQQAAELVAELARRGEDALALVGDSGPEA
jgi:hypothetical protein